MWRFLQVEAKNFQVEVDDRLYSLPEKTQQYSHFLLQINWKENWSEVVASKTLCVCLPFYQHISCFRKLLQSMFNSNLTGQVIFCSRRSYMKSCWNRVMSSREGKNIARNWLILPVSSLQNFKLESVWNTVYIKILSVPGGFHHVSMWNLNMPQAILFI